jgi:predicted RNase H-related nuclease YkuK (DUF458 family)
MGLTRVSDPGIPNDSMENEIREGQFFSPSKGNMDFQEVIRQMYDYISEKPEFFYDIVVGCDSPSTDKPFFPIAIVVLRTGAGGRFFLKKMHYPDAYLKALYACANQLEAAYSAGSVFIV